MLLTISILYMGYQWILMSTFAYYMRFLLNLLSFCAITIFLIMISIWLLRKCSNRIHMVLGFLFSLLGIWASSLYSCLGFIFFSPTPKKKKIYLVVEGNQVQIRISYALRIDFLKICNKFLEKKHHCLILFTSIAFGIRIPIFYGLDPLYLLFYNRQGQFLHSKMKLKLFDWNPQKFLLCLQTHLFLPMSLDV